MRVGVRLGPVSVSGNTRGRHHSSNNGNSPSGWAVLGVLLGIAAVFWPLALGREPHGRWHSWVWFIAVPWWVLCAFIALGLIVSAIDDKHKN